MSYIFIYIVLLVVLSIYHIVCQEIEVIDRNFANYYAKKIHECFQYNRIQRVTARDINTLLYYNSSDDPVITVEKWIDKIDADNLNILTQCVKKIYPDNFLSRPFDIKGYGGGNNVTFLNEILQIAYPELLDQVLSVAGAITDTLGWRPHPNHLGIRCIEVAEYGPGGELLFHYDDESIYTLSVVISSPEHDFEGGSFAISNNQFGKPYTSGNITTTYIDPKQYGGVIFDSNMAHGITAISNGSRTAFVIELWPYEDSGFDEQRPPGSLKFQKAKIAKLLRVPVLTDPAESAPSKAVLSLDFDMRDAIMFSIGMLLGLVIALSFIELEDWMTSTKNIGSQSKKAVPRSSAAAATPASAPAPAASPNKKSAAEKKNK
jgi:hypothetical protein